jgi:formylglycine-generating enzyme required for sulfatase activity/serine/threonine protein kinase
MSTLDYTLPPGYTLDHYHIASVLGVGGFGITYKAHDLQLQQPVAIKEYLPAQFAGRAPDNITVQPSAHTADDFLFGLDKFLDEARVLARFKHPNIVRVQRFIEANGTAYLIMDYEAGNTLQQYLEGSSMPPPEGNLLEMLSAVLTGLVAVHSAGYLHRDIKPANIYLRQQGPPLLIDFGAARQAAGAHTRGVTGLVSLGYAPPEQYLADASKQGPWTDLYGLGATLYRCISGVEPVDSPSRREALHEGDPDPMPPASQIGQGRYQPALLALIDELLIPGYRQRPRSTEAVLASLREIQGSAPTVPLTVQSSATRTQWVPEAERGFAPRSTADIATTVKPVRPTPVPLPPRAKRRSRAWWLLFLLVPGALSWYNWPAVRHTVEPWIPGAIQTRLAQLQASLTQAPPGDPQPPGALRPTGASAPTDPARQETHPANPRTQPEPERNPALIPGIAGASSVSAAKQAQRPAASVSEPPAARPNAQPLGIPAETTPPVTPTPPTTQSTAGQTAASAAIIAAGRTLTSRPRSAIPQSTTPVPATGDEQALFDTPPGQQHPGEAAAEAIAETPRSQAPDEKALFGQSRSAPPSATTPDTADTAASTAAAVTAIAGVANAAGAVTRAGTAGALPTVTPPVPRGEPATAATSTSPGPVAAGGIPSEGGRLQLDKLPGNARVIVTDSAQAYTPGMALATGVYEVRVEQAGYANWRQQISVESGKTTRAEVTLSPRPSCTTSAATTLCSEPLRDGGQGPDMIVLPPSGPFEMGDLSGQGSLDEQPVRQVMLKRRIAMMAYEVTVADFNRFAGAKGKPLREGPGNLPVVNVTWDDAEDYAHWLRKQTRKRYRLPSEAEWEFAARSRTRTLYPWGNHIGLDRANCDGCGKTFTGPGPAATGSFRPNAFGLYDMHGNVSEWVKNCYFDSYKGAPKSGQARSNPYCERRSLRGGSWADSPQALRSASRDWLLAKYRKDVTGFRLVQELKR